MRRLVRASLCLAAFALMGQDVTITFSAMDSMKSSRKSTEVAYYSAQYQRTNNEREKTDELYDYGASAMYQIDHKKKSIGRMGLDDVKRLSEFLAAKVEESKKKGGNSEIAMARRLLGISDRSQVSVQKAGSETIAGRACEKWVISLGGIKVTTSADPSLTSPAPKDALEKAGALTDSGMMQAVGMMMGDAFKKFSETLQGIKGIPLKTEMQMSTQTPMGPMIMTKTMEATKIEIGPIPDSVFELPKGYKEEDLGKKMLAEMQKEFR